MLQDQVIPVSLDGGIDSKTNPKVIVAGKFLFVENAVFTNPGEIEKRNGYTALPTAIMGSGNLVAPQMVRVYQGELICQDQGNLYGYSPSLQVWVNKGPYTSVDLTESFIYKELSIAYADCMVMGNYALYAWSTFQDQNSPIQTMIALVDLSSGSFLIPPTTASTRYNPPTHFFTTYPKCFLIGGSVLAVSYLNSTGLVARLITVSSGSVSYGSEITLQSGIGGNGIATPSPYDIVGTPGASVFVCRVPGTPNQIKVGVINTSGGVTGNIYSANLTSTAGWYPLTVSCDATTGNVWFYYGDDNNTANSAFVKYFVLSSSFFSQILGPTLVTGLSSLQAVTQLSALPISSTQQSIYCGSIHTDSASGQSIDQGYQAGVTSTGSGSGASPLPVGIAPFSRPFTWNNRNYMVFVYRGPTVDTTYNLTQNTQPTFFVIDLISNAVVSRFAAGLAASNSSLNLGHLPNVAVFSSTQFIFACGIQFQFLSTHAQVPSLIGLASVKLDFGSARAYRGVTSGQLLVLNGGLTSMYDGKSCTEFGFHLGPEIVKCVSASTGGAIVGGTVAAPNNYSYIAVFQWTDAQGNFHQSETSAALEISLTNSSTTNSNTLYVSMASMAAKTNVVLAIFRTKANGSNYYMLTDPVNVNLNNPANYIFSLVDTLADVSSGVDLASKQSLYTNGNVVDNSPPPPSMIMESRQDRLWMVDSENPNTLWYTKSFSPGTGLSPSAFLQLQIDPKHGNIAGLSEMDDKMIVLKDRGVFFFAGDGANDTGAGSTLTTPQILPSDQGCNSLKSILLTPNGVFFKGPKGIYLLDRALQSHYVGAEVEKWNAQSITAATLVTDKSQIRFLTDSGVTLVYDYLLGKWAYFTNHQGYAADNYQGLYTYVRTDGNIYQENGTSFLDGATAFRLRARLGWLALAGVQGFQRVRRLGLLGDYSNGTSTGHGVQISAAYDFVETFLAAVSYLFGSASSNGTFQYRERLLQQKCDSLSLLIEEVTTGASGESVALTNLSLEAGVKRGLRKAPATQTVG